MRKIISLENKEADIPSITAMAIFLYFVFALVTAKLIFLQFSLPEVLSVAFLFLGIIVSIGAVFLRFEKSVSLNVNVKNIIAAAFVFSLLAAFSMTSTEDIDFYLSPFPLLETELGISWNHDTAFHVSLIQSILNFGYPSTAQHGHPLNIYHVLTHYVDALIIKITGLEPYDSYGLFTHFKFFTLVSSIVLAISAIAQRQGILVYLFSIMLLTPLIIGNGLAIGSHGLWMAGVMLLLSSPFLFSTLFKESSISKFNLLALFTIIVIIAFGKVSSGFMLGSIVGTVVLARGLKQPSTYIFGAMLLLFFYIYGSLFSASYIGSKAALTLTNISIEGLYHYYFGAAVYPNAIILTRPILALIFILGAILYLDTHKVTGSALLASIVSALSLYFVTTSTNMVTSDIWYFQFGLFNALLLMTYSILIIRYNSIRNGLISIVWLVSYTIVIKHFQKVQNLLSGIKGRSVLNAIAGAIIVIGLVQILLKNHFYLLTRGYNFYNCANASLSIVYKCTLERIDGGLDSTNERFGRINKKLPEDLHLSLKTLYVSGPENLKDKAFSKFSDSRPLYDLRRNLDEQLSKNGIAKKNVALFIQKSIFNDFQNKFHGDDWDQGLLIYAVTGVQLIHGILDYKYGYGIASYVNNPDALRINRDELSIEKSCKSVAGVTHIAIINQLSPPQIDIVQCNKS